jgi:hypothetical protein
VQESEIIERNATRTLAELLPPELGRKERAAALTPTADSNFTPVGLGKPLTIRLEHIYTGDAPSFLFRGTDLLVVSAIKPDKASAPGARAIQLLMENIADCQPIDILPAVKLGSPVIYHTPAVVDLATSVTVEMIADAFPKGSFDQVAKVAGTAAGLPIFAVGNPKIGLALLAGAGVARLLGKLGEAIYDGNPFVSDSYSVNFTSILPNTPPGPVLFTNPRHAEELARNCELRQGEGFGLYNRNGGGAYRGKAAYAVVSIDGAPRPDLKDFAPRLATAVEMDRFYSGERTGQVLEVIQEGITLYNNQSFRRKAAEQARVMELIKDPDSEERKAAKLLHDAYIKHIVE